ncbi:MAG: NADH-quinone oxidoreductase subunit C [Actinomycetota bacterium]
MTDEETTEAEDTEAEATEAPTEEAEAEESADADAEADAAEESDDEAATEEAEAEAAAEEAVSYGCLVTYSRDQKVIHVPRDRWLSVAEELLADGWNMCIDVTAVDYLAYGPARSLPEGVQPERFEVVASFISHRRRERIRARAQVPADDPTIDSLYALYPGSDYLEREVFDLMGITFTGHPDMSRILMPETWTGHPLRKDYAVGAIPVQFKAPKAGSYLEGVEQGQGVS